MPLLLRKLLVPLVQMWTGAFTRAVGTYAQYKGNIQPTISFPSDCDASNFLAEVPQGVNKLPTWGAGAGSYFIDAETQSVSTWSGASKIYVTGTVDLSNGEVSAIMFNVDAIYIAEGATLQTAGILKANSNTKVYNHGTISVGTFEVNTSSFLYNVGTLTAESVNAESNRWYC